MRRIRRAEIGDAAAVRAIYAPYVSDQATSFEVVVPDTAEMTRRIASLGDRYPWLVFEEDDEVRGYAYASPHRVRQAYQWSVDVSVYIEPSAHRRGVGRALYTALFALLRKQCYMNAYAGITLPNGASVGLHESMGFVPVGVYARVGFKFDRWHDVGWWQLRLSDAERPPGDPRLTSEVWPDPDVSTWLAACATSVRPGRA
jgi:L-amino acid N-acyltransferase YncA